ncbi:MAG: DUF624 domain-containing protein [Lachnospiraceae bacterium]|nr:DUF624 domain-containing protein [Lachnospiraceae bacterium]
MGFLNIDSPFMQALGRLADIMILNLLALVCCLPIITIGPSLTALHYVSLKIARNEECYIAKSFFKAFRLNMKQGIVLGLIIFFAIGIVIADLFIIQNSNIALQAMMQVVILAVGILVLFTATFVFPIQAKFTNTIFKTLKNAFVISILQFPKTILMIVINAIPIVLFIFLPQTTPFVILFGLSVPAFLAAKLYHKFFRKLENQITEAKKERERLERGDTPEEPEEDVRIFRDESDLTNEDK